MLKYKKMCYLCKIMRLSYKERDKQTFFIAT